MMKRQNFREISVTKSCLEAHSQTWTSFQGGVLVRKEGVLMPKLDPAPRMAQNKSGLEVADTVISRPSAVTRRTDTKESINRPKTPWYRPIPAPRVTPTKPGQLQEPEADFCISEQF